VLTATHGARQVSNAKLASLVNEQRLTKIRRDMKRSKLSAKKITGQIMKAEQSAKRNMRQAKARKAASASKNFLKRIEEMKRQGKAREGKLKQLRSKITAHQLTIKSLSRNLGKMNAQKRGAQKSALLAQLAKLKKQQGRSNADKFSLRSKLQSLEATHAAIQK